MDCECADRDDYGHYYDGIPQGYYVRETLDGEELVRTVVAFFDGAILDGVLAASRFDDLAILFVLFLKLVDPV